MYEEIDLAVGEQHFALLAAARVELQAVGEQRHCAQLPRLGERTLLVTHQLALQQRQAATGRYLGTTCSVNIIHGYM